VQQSAQSRTSPISEQSVPPELHLGGAEGPPTFFHLFGPDHRRPLKTETGLQHADNLHFRCDRTSLFVSARFVTLQDSSSWGIIGNVGCTNSVHRVHRFTTRSSCKSSRNGAAHDSLEFQRVSSDQCSFQRVQFQHKRLRNQYSWSTRGLARYSRTTSYRICDVPISPSTRMPPMSSPPYRLTPRLFHSRK
jgi:hypothetical protein